MMRPSFPIGHRPCEGEITFRGIRNGNAGFGRYSDGEPRATRCPRRQGSSSPFATGPAGGHASSLRDLVGQSPRLGPGTPREAAVPQGRSAPCASRSFASRSSPSGRRPARAAPAASFDPRAAVPPAHHQETRPPFDPYEPEQPAKRRRMTASKFQDPGVNPFIPAERDRESTFALDVDTAAYTIAQGGFMGDSNLPGPGIRSGSRSS